MIKIKKNLNILFLFIFFQWIIPIIYGVREKYLKKKYSPILRKTSSWWVDINRYKGMKLLYISFFSPSATSSSFNFFIWKMQAIIQSLSSHLKNILWTYIENVCTLFIDFALSRNLNWFSEESLYRKWHKEKYYIE